MNVQEAQLKTSWVCVYFGCMCSLYPEMRWLVLSTNHRRLTLCDTDGASLQTTLTRLFSERTSHFKRACTSVPRHFCPLRSTVNCSLQFSHFTGLIELNESMAEADSRAGNSEIAFGLLDCLSMSRRSSKWVALINSATGPFLALRHPLPHRHVPKPPSQAPLYQGYVVLHCLDRCATNSLEQVSGKKSRWRTYHR